MSAHAITFPDPSRVEGATVSTLIKTDSDVLSWKTTSGYRNYILFIDTLCDSIIQSFELDPSTEIPASIQKVVDLLAQLDAWIDDIPPEPTPQRFGNRAFRTWGARLEQSAAEVLGSLLPKSLHFSIPLLEPYLITSFGSFGRIDYGTGHEVSFAHLILCLVLLKQISLEETNCRVLVHVVFKKYLKLVHRLQDVYRLEPAGSHGVWGLDDYSFLPYIFGAAQLQGTKSSPNDVLPLVIPGYSSPQKSLDGPANTTIPPPPKLPPNMFTDSLLRILEIKSGPFWEHSPQLYSIATGVPRWEKVRSGLCKMYEAEVLGKRVVVQHLPLGGLIEWEPKGRDAEAA